jgi:thiol-disulfide isomerase/thioredoxin
VAFRRDRDPDRKACIEDCITHGGKPMKTQRKSRGGLRAALVLGLLVLGFALQAQAPNATYQFFNSANFAHLTDKDPVFRTVSYDQLLTLFESKGTYMILFGGSWCGNTQAVISQINDVAKEYGVKTIYNFDWKVDGKSVHLRDSKNPFANLYVDAVNKYLPNILVEYGNDRTKDISYTKADGTVAAAPRLQVPFLFIYNKDNKDAKGMPAPIMASYEKMLTWDKDFMTNGKDDPVKIEAYKKEIRPLFDYISTTVGGKKVAKLDYFDDFSYYMTAFNKRSGKTILEEKDRPWVMQTVSYIELTKILESPGNFVFMLGGPWCGNTQAVIKFVNEYAKKYGITKIYTFDNKLDSNVFHIRDSKNPFAYMYVDLVNKYFPGIVVEYGAMRERDISYTNADGKVVAAPRLQVPYLFVYNKDRKDAAGNPAPILGQVELMYSWENMQPTYKDEKTGLVGANYKTYTAAMDTLFTQLRNEAKK